MEERLEKIKELVNFLFETNEQDLFIAQMIYEKLDYKYDIDCVTNEDIKYADNIWDKYVKSKAYDSKWNYEINCMIDYGEEKE